MYPARQYRAIPSWQPAVGCLGLAFAFFLLCLMPFVFVDLMQTSLESLHMSPAQAMLAMIGIFAGSIFNLPVYRFEREELQLAPQRTLFGILWDQRLQPVKRETTIAVNVGGCLIPMIIAARQVFYLLDRGGWPLAALGVVVVLNVATCYVIARPVPGIGITMPGFVSPLTAVIATLVLLAPAEYAGVRAPVAFVGGVLGPLVGADLLHLKDISRVSVGMLSIGGAGTFDGIVLSGVLAALLAGPPG